MIIPQGYFFKLPALVRRNCPAALKVRTRVGAKRFIMPATDELGWWSPSWMSDFLGTILPGADGVFIDVGVNRLQTFFDLQSADGARTYIGFEPNPHCVKYALDVLRLNAVAHASIVPCALSSQNGMLDLLVHVGDVFDGTGSIIEELRPGRLLDRIPTMSLTLDNALAHLGVESIALLKIDVEGAELEVLRGAAETLRTMRPLILCEVLYRDPKADAAWFSERVDALFDLLNEARYVALRLIKPGNVPHVQSLLRVDHIGSQAFTHETFHECDYVFCPEESLKSRFEGRYNAG